MPIGPKGEKRPRDANQLAKLIVDIATGQVKDREPTPEEQGKDPAAVARGKLGGPLGGNARFHGRGRGYSAPRKARPPSRSPLSPDRNASWAAWS
jgi:hypothetical protein